MIRPDETNRQGFLILKMKSLLKFFLCALLALGCAVEGFSKYVKGYTRKDGTYVSGYYRSDSKSSINKSSTSTKKSTSSTSINYTEPKSYTVYKQRQEQGSRNFSQSTRKKKYQECGGVCAHCGKQCTLSEMDADHIIPYSKGGKTEDSNCQMLCQHCNRSKGNRSCK